MFRQFSIHDEDCNWLLIVWRDLLSGEPIFGTLKTVTYGESPAPFQAGASLLQLADDGAKMFSRGSHAIRKKRYKDDFYLGEDTMQELIVTRDELMHLLSTAGMAVGKLAANHAEALQDIHGSHIQQKITVIQDEEVVSTLGLRWNAIADEFCFKIAKVPVDFQITKRTML